MRAPIRGRYSGRTDLLIGLTGIGTLVICWSLATYGGFVDRIFLPSDTHIRTFLPSPTDIWAGIVDLNEKQWLLPSIWVSFRRVSVSLSLVILIGVPLGVAMGTSPSADAFLRRIVDGAKSVPTTGLIGLTVLWFGIEERAKVFFLFLGAIFYMIVLVKNAVRDVSEHYLRVAVDLGATRSQLIGRVLLPGALPRIWDAIAVCNGIMWTYILLAEWINSNAVQLGLGYLLWIGSRTNSPGQVFAILIIIAIISALTDSLLRLVRSLWLNW